MIDVRKQFIVSFVSLLVVLPAGCHSQKTSQSATPAQVQQSDFKQVDNPGGGQYAYGTLTGQKTLSDGMVNMLKKVHDRFGDKPQIGKLFQSRDGSSLATFFTVNAKTGGGQALTGLVIVSMKKGQTPQGAAIYDYSEKFVQSEPSLLQGLSSAWSGMSGGSGAPAEQQAATPEQASYAPIKEVTAGDGSAYISMPSDWHLTGVVGGSLTAEGPHGEMLSLGILYQGISNTPTRNAFGGQPQLAYPLSSNLFPAFVSLVNQVRRINHKGPGSYKLISQKQLSSDGGAVPPIQAIFTVDFNDGIGPRKGSARIGAIHVAGLPTWAMSISTSNIPVKYADSENALMQAVIGSCHQNGRVIGAENQAVLDHIKQVGVMTQHNVDSANQRREASTASFNQSMSNQDWSSKVTQNYILDRSVVTNTETGARGTVSNNFADALVKSNPNQFQVVPNQQMIQGRDY